MMGFFTQVLKVSILTLITSSNAFTFTLNQVDSGRKILRGSVEEIRHPFAKFSGDSARCNEGNTDVAPTLKNTSVVATPLKYDQLYLIPIQIGTPAKTFMMPLDTGSSDLWAFSSLQPAAQSADHTIYVPQNSSTSKSLNGSTWRVDYNDGTNAHGLVYLDSVKLGAVTVKQQAVEAAQNVAPKFRRLKLFDGIIGFGFAQLNQVMPNPQQTWFDRARSQLSAPVFAANLKPGAPGNYDFGFINPNSYSGEIAYTPLTGTNGYWEITADGFAVGANKPVTVNIPAIADTGTSVIYMPSNVLKAYYRNVKSAQNIPGFGIAVNCNEQLPDFSFVFGGQKRTVPGEYITYAPLQGERGLCAAGLQSSSGLPFGIIGDVFLKSQYVIFDYGKRRIGFAQQA